MWIVREIEKLDVHLSVLKEQNLKIGFVPTMGALHDGHLSLVFRALEECDICVVSIFVNPTQFNDKDDLERYPRNLPKDMLMLQEVGNHFLFAPSVGTIYPPNTTVKDNFDFGAIAGLLEGAHRPGHFEGMAQVVNRLLEIVKPDKLFMGQKDYQQQLIVRKLIASEGHQTKLVMCPIRREIDGLAMSSRNARLTPEWRAKAPMINAALKTATDQISTSTPEKIIDEAQTKLEAEGFVVEYVSIADAESLLPVSDFGENQTLVLLVAAWAGEIRLIDNVIYQSQG